MPIALLGRMSTQLNDAYCNFDCSRKETEAASPESAE
jgi:hypothetical protein